MRKIKFSKMVASGNDFVVSSQLSAFSSQQLTILAKKICDRKYGVGADGLLILEESGVADTRMRIFNADGSEAEMCGNGARCIALYVGKINTSIETKAGIIESQVKGRNVKIKLTDPKSIKLDFPIKIFNRRLKVNYIDTGVPHVVIFVRGLDNIDLKGVGRAVRYHKQFSPLGVNVNFVEVKKDDFIRLRTYERGVEGETLACGTGCVASALIFSLKTGINKKIKLQTESGEILKVYFQKEKNKFRDVWLEGKAKLVYKG
ncbi:MAG: diaminopimelate epimerase, partial [Candidatus Omnitrophica bacterium]|nr:diaminopimelate epimerase [Candidatus Omnitrophota bacterium]